MAEFMINKALHINMIAFLTFVTQVIRMKLNIPDLLSCTKGGIYGPV